MFSEENLHEAIQQSTRKPIIGALVWWQVDDLYIPRSEMRERFERHHIVDAIIENRPRRALKRALREAEQKQMLRQVADDEERLAYAFVEETADESRLELDYTMTSLVIFNKRTQELEFRLKVPGSEIEQNFRKFLDGYTETEVREMLKKYITGSTVQGFVARDVGGIYYIPAEAIDCIRSLEQALEGLPVKIFMMGIADSERERREALALWMAEVDRTIIAMQQDLDKVLGRGIRQATVEDRLAAIEDLKRRASRYARDFAFQRDELDKKLAEFEMLLMGAL